jgi:hypothetical protein
MKAIMLHRAVENEAEHFHIIDDVVLHEDGRVQRDKHEPEYLYLRRLQFCVLTKSVSSGSSWL